jgi:hypothetical protein
MEGIEAIDAATVPPPARGSPFSVLDYATVAVVTSLSSKPVLLRTQKKLTAADITKVLGLGVKGLVVDPCILSGTEEVYKDELLRFRVGSGEANSRSPSE